MHVIFDLETLFRVEYVRVLMAMILPHFICPVLKIYYLQL
jgi:hypothetical protein